jgi:hypothetical protein
MLYPCEDTTLIHPVTINMMQSEIENLKGKTQLWKFISGFFLNLDVDVGLKNV